MLLQFAFSFYFQNFRNHTLVISNLRGERPQDIRHARVFTAVLSWSEILVDWRFDMLTKPKKTWQLVERQSS